MKSKRLFWPILRRTAAALLAFWLLMVLTLSYLNFRSRKNEVESAVDNSRRAAAAEYLRMQESTASEVQLPAILTNHLAFNDLLNLGGICLTRIYDKNWNEAARSPIAVGSVSLPGTGTYSLFLAFDKVLGDEGQIALARRLRDDPDLSRFFGTSGGLYKDAKNAGLYGEVTGILAEEEGIIYPKKLVYYYEEGTPVTVMESNSPLFEGGELTTVTFDAAQISSQLEGPGATHEQYLAHYRVAEKALDDLIQEQWEQEFRSPRYQHDSSNYGGYGAERGGVSDVMVGSAYSYSDFTLLTYGLGPTYVLTFLAALMLAIFISRWQASALEREQDLTRAVAHELKTPLAILRSHAEALQEDIDPAKRSAYLNIIMDESDRMAALVGELLDLSRMEAGAEVLHRESVDLKALTERVFAPLQNLARVSLNLVPLTVSGDPKLLERAISNYASNALRHCADGGEIRVTLRRERENALLTVENDGDPIPPEALPHLWDTFYKADAARTRGQGTGLGLAIVKSIATLHGGSCGAENLPGGVTFCLRLPLRKSPDCADGPPVV